MGGILALWFAGRDRILENWYMYRFDRGEEEEKILAAEKLGAMGSSYGLAWLLTEERKDYTAVLERTSAMNTFAWRLRSGGPIPAVGERGKRFETALVRIGKPAIPFLVVALQGDAVAQYLSENALVRMCQESESIEVREQAGRALGDYIYTRDGPELIDPIWPPLERERSRTTR